MYILIFLLTLFTFSNATITISPVQIPDELVGIYKVKSAKASYTNGTSINLTSTQLAGSFSLLNKNGTAASVAHFLMLRT